MNKFKHKLKEEVIHPKDIPPELFQRIEKKYGPIDMENDFFSSDLDTYFKFSSKDEKTGAIENQVIHLGRNIAEPLRNLQGALIKFLALNRSSEFRSNPDIKEFTKKTRDLFNEYRTYLRKYYPEEYKEIIDKLEEISISGGSASFTPGVGMQYATPYAFKGKNKKNSKNNKFIFKYMKPVPKHIKNSGLKTKKLFEQDKSNSSSDFQQDRIKAFDEIETELNTIYQMLSNAKNETSEYYASNPGSFTIVKPTDLILSYLKDIKTLLS